MKIYSVALLLFFSFFIASAQQVKWSEVITDKDYDYEKIIGQNEEGFFVLRSNISFEDDRDHVGFRGRKYNLTLYSNDMALKWSHELVAPAKDGKIASVNIVSGKAVVTSYLADKKQKAYIVFAEYLNAGGNYADSSTIVVKADYDKVESKEKPDVYVSQNQKCIAFLYRTQPATKDEQNYNIVIVDSSLSVISNKSFTVPFSEKHFVYENLVVSNAGGFYFFGTHYLNDKKEKVTGESFYVMYRCNNTADDVRSEEVNPATSGEAGSAHTFLISATPTYDNINHKIVIAGFYSAGSAYSLAGTFYFAERTDTVHAPQIKTSPFDGNFLSKLHGNIKSSSRDLPGYPINRIILRRDGGAVIMAEAVSTTYSSYYDYFTRMYITHRYYLYGNIIVFSVNPDGSILWSNVITKDQQSEDDGGYYSSYCSDIYASKMFFIYNKYIGDNPSILSTTINSKGEQKTDVLINEEEKVLAIPTGGKQIAEDELVMPALKERKTRFMKISF